MNPPKLTIARVVRSHHGNTFTEELFAALWSTGTPYDSFAETHLIGWPDDETRSDLAEAQQRYRVIETEIIRRTFEAVERRLADAFVEAATEVLNRERRG